MTTINQQDYLKKYLDKKTHKSKEKKKKKKISSSQAKGFHIIEDSADLKTIPYGSVDDDCAPTVAEITYDDEKTKLIDQYQINKKKWKVLNEDDINEKHAVSEDQQEFSVYINNEDISQSSSHNGSSPPVRLSKDRSYLSLKPNKKNDSIPSPARREWYDSQSSPVRRKRHDSDSSPVRPNRHDSHSPPVQRKRHDSDSSPVRPNKHNSLSSPVRRKRHDSDSSPVRPNGHDSHSPPVRRKRHDSDSSPVRPNRHDSHSYSPTVWRKRHDSDSSPVRPKKHDSHSSPVRRKRHDSDSSPVRSKKHDSHSSPVRRKRHDSDSSPVRSKKHESHSPSFRRKRHDLDSSPVRRKRNDSDSSPVRRNEGDSQSSSARCYSGSIESAIRDEKESSFSGQEKEYLSSFSKKKSVEHTKSIGFKKLRNKKTRELTEEEKALARKMDEKYQKWNKGIVQVQKRKDDLDYTIHEMGKSFARSADDKDMNDQLKNILRQDDPMLEYVTRKKSRECSQPTKPTYKGSFPPNRCHIRPGYRWDGVDRSNGFEKEWFNRQSLKSATESESYKWSTEDM